MDGGVEIFQTSEFYIFLRGPCTLFINRHNGEVAFKPGEIFFSHY